jgi:hypothetical protein
MLPQSRPGAHAETDRGIDLVAGEIGQDVRGLEPHGKRGMLDLKGPQPLRQPVGGEGQSGADRQNAFVLVDDARESVGQAVERAGHERSDPPPRLGEGDPPLAAQEQRHPQSLLEQLDLIADRGLGHSELHRGLGEILVAGGGLEHSHGGQRRDGAHA